MEFLLEIFLGALAKVCKATISFVISVCLSVYRPLRPHGKKNSARTGRIFMKFDI